MNWREFVDFVGGSMHDLSDWLIQKGQHMLRDVTRRGE